MTLLVFIVLLVVILVEQLCHLGLGRFCLLASYPSEPWLEPL